MQQRLARNKSGARVRGSGVRGARMRGARVRGIRVRWSGVRRAWVRRARMCRVSLTLFGLVNVLVHVSLLVFQKPCHAPDWGTLVRKDMMPLLHIFFQGWGVS